MSELLWQAIQKVPGLTGSWQQRNRQLYEMMGSPMGAYKGDYAQNIMLLNKIRQTNYFAGGLPGQPAPQPAAPVGPPPAPPQQTIAEQNLANVKPNTDIYSEDVMKQDAWFDPFDEWTRNYVNTYMKDEWEKDTYNPAMQSMTQNLSNKEMQMGGSGAWRSGVARKNLANLAKEMEREEFNMRRDFQDSSVNMRDEIRDKLAAPLYNANMTRWGDSVWRDMNLTGADTGQIRNDLGGSLSGQYLNDLLNKVNNWTPNAGGGGTIRDWTVTPNSPYSANLYKQYAGGVY